MGLLIFGFLLLGFYCSVILLQHARVMFLLVYVGHFAV